MGVSSNIKKIKNSFYILKLRELKHRIYYKKSYDRMRDSMKRYRLCQDKKPRIQIINEIKLCKKYWGCYPLHYFRYDLYKKDKQLSQQQLLDYIPEFFFYSLYLPYYDSHKYSILTEDKNITEVLFNRLDIGQPNTIFRLINCKYYDEKYNIIKFVDIIKGLNEKPVNKIFMKPVDGQGGHGILIFNNHDGEYYTKDGKFFDEKLLEELGRDRDYIFQEGIKQDASIAKLYPKSVNTFRIATVNNKGESNIICSTLRTGKDNKEIDNGTQGGIVLGIDIETGKCMEYGITETGQKFICHPDTGFVFKDYKIDRWNEIKEFVLECANKLSHFTYLGWDIALTENGPIAIETNLNFGIDHYQVPLGGLRRIFRIEDPMAYWKNSC